MRHKEPDCGLLSGVLQGSLLPGPAKQHEGPQFEGCFQQKLVSAGQKTGLNTQIGGFSSRRLRAKSPRFGQNFSLQLKLFGKRAAEGGEFPE